MTEQATGLHHVRAVNLTRAASSKGGKEEGRKEYRDAVDHARRDARLLREGTYRQGRQRGGLCRLDHSSTAGSQCRSELPMMAW